MKFSISILAGNRTALKHNIRTQTSNAESYLNDAKRNREHAKTALKQAEREEAAASRACMERNKFQAQLNEIDAAIAKLES